MSIDRSGPADAGRSPSLTGLTAAEVAERVADGRTNAVELRGSRTVAEIVRANVFTFFNGLLFVLFLITIATGRWQNGLFGVVIVANAAIGIVQEVRAKRTLDRLTVLNALQARVVRDGKSSDVEMADVVADDLVELRAGDQVPADGVVIDSDGLEVNESLLTGESDSVVKAPGEEVRSGSVVVAGRGRFQATVVGAEAYATKLAADARRFTVVHSELVAGTNRILRWISVLMLLVGPVLLWSQFRSKDNNGWRDAVTGAVAGMVGMVPEGLVLLTSLAFMLATVTLARRQTLVQELPAVEGLARVDVVCLDKTGTLTYGDVAFDHLEILGDCAESDVGHALGLLSAGVEGNATAAAVAAAFPATEWRRTGSVPFNSTRKWSAVTTADHGAWVLGAPEMVLPGPTPGPQEQARAASNRFAEAGRRVLLLARSISADWPDSPVGSGSNGDVALPAKLMPAALVILAERVREDAAETLQFFTTQGVALKVISGDNPRTVGAVAMAVGVPGAADPVDARTLPDDLDELADELERHSVFGRVTPQQKRAVVAALQRRGHVVAMTGDGVNDVLALKDADIGIAMGNGSPATRAVAQLVLLDGQFARLPGVVAEGRRVIANIERASNLFLIKNTYSLVLALIAAVTLGAYPLAPIQLTLISALTIGVPGFALALAPNARRYVPGFVRRVLRFSVPIGVVTGVSVYLGYRTTRFLTSGAGVAEGRTTAMIVGLIVSLWTVVVLARPLTGWKVGLVAATGGVVAVVVTVPAIGRGLFLLSTTPLDLAVAGVVGIAGAVFVEITHRAVAAGLYGGPNRDTGENPPSDTY
jgi:cation-transporting P-type ATPase E